MSSIFLQIFYLYKLIDFCRVGIEHMSLFNSEFSGINFGDSRLGARFKRVIDAMMNSPLQSISGACRGWAETMGAYRLFNNDKVTSDKIMEPHRRALVERAKLHSCIGLVQDTTELDYSTQATMQGPGVLNSPNRRGYFLHCQYVVSLDRLPLGVWNSKLVVRDSLKKYDWKRSIEEKESYRWLEGYHHACALAKELPDQQVFSISDREGDIYEVYEARQALEKSGETGAHFLIRSNLDRLLLEAKGIDSQPLLEVNKLFETSRNGTALGCVQFCLSARKGFKKVKGTTRAFTRKARNVRQQIKACELTLRPPKRYNRKAPTVRIWAVVAEEIDPPEGHEPINWILLTSFPITCFADAEKIIQLYIARWDIEVFHRVLKTGCKIENIQFKTQKAFEPTLACYMVIAWRILYLTHLGRQCPDLPCSVVFDENEWRGGLAVALKCGAPDELEEPTLGEMIKIVATFGGYLGRKHDGPPGAQTMWIGLTRVRDFAIALEVYRLSRK